MKKINKKSLLLLIAVAVIFMAAIGGTVAYLVTSTPEITNVFEPVTTGVQVTDKIENGVKKDVVITNNSSIPVYLRVAVIANWCNAGGQIVAPWSDYTGLGVDPTKWTFKDGYYYYNGTVAANGSVTLFNEYTQPSPTVTGAHLEMDVIAQVIQAEPTSAVQAAWGFVPGSATTN